MKPTPPSERLEVKMTGPIGETTPLFQLPVADLKEIVLDMSDVTYINSIGVKHWIMWTLRIPKSAKVLIVNCPQVIVSQANTVVGFMVPQMRIESFRIPYACEECGFEDVRMVQRGVDYDYATNTEPNRFGVPKAITCPKCSKGSLEPDVFIEKTFKFLG